jgi:hypothetical protein
MKDKATENVVLDKEQLFSGREYQLTQLPDSVNFTWSEKLYRTITYPKYNTQKLNGNNRKSKRTCLNLRTLQDEEIGYYQTVKVV